MTPKAERAGPPTLSAVGDCTTAMRSARFTLWRAVATKMASHIFTQPCETGGAVTGGL